MIGLGLGIFFVSYWVFTYGWSQNRGCNAGFLDVGWPGRYTGCNPDGGGATNKGGTNFGGVLGKQCGPNKPCPAGQRCAGGKCIGMSGAGK